MNVSPYLNLKSLLASYLLEVRFVGDVLPELVLGLLHNLLLLVLGHDQARNALYLRGERSRWTANNNTLSAVGRSVASI